MVRKSAQVNYFSQTAATIQGISRMTRRKAVEYCYTQMVTTTVVNGKMTRLTATDNTILWVGEGMRDTGKTTNDMVMGRRLGRTAQNLKETTNSTKRMALENSSTVMEIPLLENSRKVKKTARALWLGRTEGVTKVIGKMIECTERAFSHGLLAKFTRGIITRTKNTVRASWHTETVHTTRGSGCSARDTGREC